MSPLHGLIARNRNGERVGLPCYCTANGHVLRAILEQVALTDGPCVIEATSNQVNQDGGYTGMRPADFVDWLGDMAAEAGVPTGRLILGGDHLGPNPWRDQPAETAMGHARDLVRLYVEAGFTKLHLDASMACGGEANPSFAQIAARAAELCAVAETHAPDPAALAYVIGTEVPVPGGETEEPDALDVTSVDRLHETLRTHRDAWAARDLTAAWGRIVAVVTQPGVDFGHTSVYPFVPEKAAPLGEAILEEDGLAFEAHSTDYQPDAALADLVRGHFFFLKVGPELTFRFREAVLALGTIEEVLALPDPSRIAAVLDDRMLAVPNHWQAYYRGTQDEQRLLRTYGYSDRIRYYWTDPFVAAALEKLLANLSAQPLSETLVSQAFMALDFDAIPHTPEALINLHVQRCIDRYRIACGQ